MDFSSTRSCVTQLITTAHDFAQCLNEKDIVTYYCWALVQHLTRFPGPFLTLMLFHYGIRGTLLTWIENFLSNRSQRVILDNKQSSPSDVLSGVPQGTVLVHLLFLIKQVVLFK